MKNKIISILLAISSLLSVVSVTAFAENESKYATEIAIMKSLGIFSDLDREENEYVTRADFATWLAELGNYKAPVGVNQSPFYDVNSQTEKYDGIVNAARNGIVYGETDKNFYPDRIVTYAEAATMAVNALGYYEVLNAGKETNGTYISTASNIGLNKNLNASISDRMTFGMSARLLINTGLTNILAKSLNGDWYAVDGGETLFWNKQSIAIYEGVVEQNEFTALNSKTGCKTDRLIISGATFECYDWVQAYNSIGLKVKCWYKEVDGVAVALYLDDAKSDVITYQSGDLVHKNGYLYTNEEKDKQEIPTTASVIYNGVFTTEYYPAGGDIFVPENGYVKFINNDSDKETDVISIVSYENMLVGTVRAADKVINNALDAQKGLDFAKAEKEGKKWIFTDVNGKEIEISSAKANNIVSIARSEDSKVLWAILSTASDAGIVEAMNIDEYGKQLITIDGKTYKVNQSYIDAGGFVPSSGNNVTVYIDAMGNIAYIELTKTSDAQYGFYINAEINQGDKTISVDMMNMTGKGGVATYEMADRVMIDGLIYKKKGGVNDLYAYMTVEDTFNKSITTPAENIGKLEPYQVIVYKLNADGKINYIDTVKNNPAQEGDTGLRLLNKEKLASEYRYDETTKKYQTYGTERHAIPIGAGTKIIETPMFDNMDDFYGYRVRAQNDLGNMTTQTTSSGSKYATVLAYTTNPDSLIPELLHIPTKEEDPASIAMSNTNGLVTEIRQTLNIDNEPCYSITYLAGTAKAVTKFTTPDATIPAGGVESGDYCVFSFNYEGLITGVALLATLDETGKAYTMKAYGSAGGVVEPTDKTFANSNKLEAGWNYATEENVFFMDRNQSWDVNALFAVPVVQTYAKVYVISGEAKSKKEVTEVTVANINTLPNFKNDYERIPMLIYAVNGVPRLVALYVEE